MTQLTKNFTLEELTVTNSGLENIPDDVQLENLRVLAVHVLQPLRDLFEKNIHVNSGFRSAQVNEAVGGAATSQHTKGQAADLDSEDNAKLFSLIKSKLEFDQLIWEKGNNLQPEWVHVSYNAQRNRKEILKFNGKKYIKIF